MRASIVLLVALLGLTTAFLASAQDEKLKPYGHAGSDTGTIEDKLPGVKEALTANGFEIAGEYEPFDGAHVIAVTSDALKQNAAASDFGGYGAALRVSLTEADDVVQVAWTDPCYMANVYRMAGDLEDVRSKLEAALGKSTPFGSKKGMKAKDLRKYHYMIGMPYFDDAVTLAKHDSHAAAVEAVEQGLAAGTGGTTKVYRVDVPGKDEVLFGVGLSAGDGADATVIGTCDVAELKHTPYLPYELLVSGDTVYALHAKFRIALSFPDLGMVTFMKISGAPKAIQKTLRSVAERADS
jgi:hypothetical protein